MSTEVVCTARVVQLMRVMGEARELKEGRRAQKLHVAAGLRKVVGAEVCALVVDNDFVAHGRGCVIDVTDIGWAGARDRERVWSLLAERGTAFDPALGAVMRQGAVQRPGNCWAFRREDVVSDRAWYRSLIVSEAWRACKVDDSIYAGRRAPDGLTHGVGVKREWGSRRFDAEDRNLVRLFMEVSEWLWAPDPIDAVQKLAPRERATLRCLLEGDSVKQVAWRLGISRYTAQGYVKSVYRALHVHSRGELLALFLPQEQRALFDAPHRLH